MYQNSTLHYINMYDYMLIKKYFVTHCVINVPRLKSVLSIRFVIVAPLPLWELLTYETKFLQEGIKTIESKSVKNICQANTNQWKAWMDQYQINYISKQRKLLETWDQGINSLQKHNDSVNIYKPKTKNLKYIKEKVKELKKTYKSTITLGDLTAPSQ
jgi:predicted patatin/cPLA2 family phospholipase